MKLNERHLMELAAVLDAGGVSEGAAMLGLARPTVSRSLAMLQARVGEQLFPIASCFKPDFGYRDRSPYGNALQSWQVLS